MTKGIKIKDIRDFKKYANKLNQILTRIREYAPEASYYATPDELHLMAGFSFDRDSSREEQENLLVTSVSINHLEAGDW